MFCSIVVPIDLAEPVISKLAIDHAVMLVKLSGGKVTLVNVVPIMPLMMLDTVPEKSEYDYGESYLRCISTFIPRPLWPTKPIYGREQWLNAWIAGSELKRDDDFTGPAIGILGAAQLNGGAVGTLIVLAIVALAHRTAYEYFRRFPTVPLVQAFWALTYYNAWMQVANDDPMVWFYYNWGLTCMPIFALLWVLNTISGAPARATVAVERA